MVSSIVFSGSIDHPLRLSLQLMKESNDEDQPISD